MILSDFRYQDPWAKEKFTLPDFIQQSQAQQPGSLVQVASPAVNAPVLEQQQQHPGHRSECVHVKRQRHVAY